MARRTIADTDSRERMLAAGLDLARALGLRKLTVRAVATQAQANLGSFVYHFGTRDAFVEELMERLYAPLMAGLALSAAQAPDALAGLRSTLLELVGWVHSQRQFLAHLLLDANAGEIGAQRFLKSLDQRHPALLLQLIRQAQAQGHITAGDPLHVLMFLMSSLAMPVLLFHIIGQHAAAPPLARTLDGLAGRPERLQQRLDWALRGLAPLPAAAQENS